MSQLKNGAELFVDIDSCPAFQPLSNVFASLRPVLEIIESPNNSVLRTPLYGIYNCVTGSCNCVLWTSL